MPHIQESMKMITLTEKAGFIVGAIRAITLLFALFGVHDGNRGCF
jgi:hypothetical protein